MKVKINSQFIRFNVVIMGPKLDFKSFLLAERPFSQHVATLMVGYPVMDKDDLHACGGCVHTYKHAPVPPSTFFSKIFSD